MAGNDQAARGEGFHYIGLHGLRHSLASHMAMGGAQAAEIMTQLGHRQLSTALPDEDLRALRETLGGRTSSPGS
jgi:integrase